MFCDFIGVHDPWGEGGALFLVLLLLLLALSFKQVPLAGLLSVFRMITIRRSGLASHCWTTPDAVRALPLS